MYTLKLIEMGDDLGVIFPDDLLVRLQIKQGDELYLTETPDGFRITTHNPEFEEQMQVARAIMKERHAVLHDLAK